MQKSTNYGSFMVLCSTCTDGVGFECKGLGLKNQNYDFEDKFFNLLHNYVYVVKDINEFIFMGVTLFSYGKRICKL